MTQERRNLNIVGIMSGTSLDGVDFVLVSKRAKNFKYKDMASVSYTKKMKTSLLQLAEGKMGFRESQLLHFELGKFYAKSLAKIKSDKKWKINLIGLHGQTVFHQAPKATTQIGEPSFLKEFNVPVVSDFRAKILSVGGQGAPLAPIFHDAIMKEESYKRWGFLNIGGMSNLTCREGAKFTATDLGPGNVFLDGAMRKLFSKDFDKGGRVALKGLPDMKIVKSYCAKNKFLKKAAPKSCGREEFSETELSNLLKQMKKLTKEDMLATLCEITLLPIIKEIEKKKIDKLVVSGGGVYNGYLMKRLEEAFLDLEVLTSDDIGWPVQAVEGGAFALLALYKLNDVKADLSYMGLSKKLSPLGRID
ncbi:MAG: anhydro-N-acetylmuramic acid kinase [Bdellovibrionales bacterium]